MLSATACWQLSASAASLAWSVTQPRPDKTSEQRTRLASASSLYLLESVGIEVQLPLQDACAYLKALPCKQSVNC